MRIQHKLYVVDSTQALCAFISRMWIPHRLCAFHNNPMHSRWIPFIPHSPGIPCIPHEFQESHAFRTTSMHSTGLPCSPQEFHAFPRNSMHPTRIPWIPQEFHACYTKSMHSVRSPCILKKSYAVSWYIYMSAHMMCHNLDHVMTCFVSYYIVL